MVTDALTFVAIDRNAVIAIQVVPDALFVELAHLGRLRVQRQVNTNSAQACSVTPVNAITCSEHRNRVAIAAVFGVVEGIWCLTIDAD